MDNNSLLEVKIFLNKKLYEDKIISYEMFEKVEKKLIERINNYEYN